jgi:hypothetical protein
MIKQVIFAAVGQGRHLRQCPSGGALPAMGGSATRFVSKENKLHSRSPAPALTI